MLVDKSNWQLVADNMDGFWVGTPSFRELGLGQRTAIAQNGRVRRCVGEIPYSWAIQDVYHNPQAAAQAGMNVDTLMVYEEGQWGSTLTPAQIAEIKKRYPDKQLLLNVRLWLPSRDVGGEPLADVISSVDGFSYEFAVTRDEAKLNNVAAAINWGIDHKKRVYLLTPPNDTTHRYNNNYLNDYKWMHTYLKGLIGGRYYSPRLGWVPANYDFRKKGVYVGPESHTSLSGRKHSTNTQKGVARWWLLIR